MPEIKHSFAGGKMNKDLDERLVPQGEYRDAMNIQVRTTAGDGDGVGDSGSAQNVKGNKIIQSATVDFVQSYVTVIDNPNETTSVGSIADEKSNKSYFFIAGLRMPQVLENPGSINSTKYFIDNIIEVDSGVGVSEPSAVPVVTDFWGITSPKESVIGLNSVSGDTNVIPILNDIASNVRVGMSVMVFTDAGFQMLVNKVKEVIEIDGVKNIVLESEVTNINWEAAGFFKFEAERVLNFDNREKISAINVIDDLLFWTDNKGEPKKINIRRSKNGTPSYTSHTILKLNDPKDNDVLINFAPEDTNDDGVVETGSEESISNYVNNFLKEEHITVIRKSPKQAPTLEMSESDRDGEIDVVGLNFDFTLPGLQDSGNINIVNIAENNDDFGPGSIITFTGTGFFLSPNAPAWQVNDILVFTEDILAEELKATVKGIIDIYEPLNDTLQVTITSVSTNLTPQDNDIDGSGVWNIELEQRKPLFELKMGRFACRYKYVDGEYSSFSPWSELAFLPGRFDYDHRRGYNLGMVNNLRKLVIKDFIPHQTTRNADVVEVDILYKTTTSPNCYVVKSVKRGIDPEWDLFTTSSTNTNWVFGELPIKSEMIHKVLEKDQLLRPWDNVPRYAASQEVAANRIMYGNFTQGYDMSDTVGLIQSLKTENTASVESPKKSIKTIRNYRFGMVFGDKYGRETTVMSNNYLDMTSNNVSDYVVVDGGTSVEKQFASFANHFELTQNWTSSSTESGNPEDWMEYVKYYVKETSNEYYNLVMDRWYEAEDGNIWLSFNSADRNKIDEDTYLILKNEHGTNEPVVEKARYKIIAIEPDAPDFIKVDQRIIGKVELTNTEYDYMFAGGIVVNPETITPTLLMNETNIVIDEDAWDGFLDDYTAKGDLKIRVVGRNAAGLELKGRTWRFITYYGVNIDNDGVIKWNKPFLESADMLERFQNAGNVSGLTYYLEFMEEVVINNQPEFDGKFFVKVEKDQVLKDKVLKYSGESYDYDNASAMNFGYIDTQRLNPANPAAATLGPRTNYLWFDDSSVPSQYTADNPDGTNVAELDILTDGYYEYGFHDVIGATNIAGGTYDLHDTGNFIALGCDEGQGDEHAFESNYGGDGYDLINFGKPSRSYWAWIRYRVEGDIKYRLFIDSARLRYGKLEGAVQTQNPNTTDLVGDGSVLDSNWNWDGDQWRHANYYKPTGIDLGYQDGANFNPTENGELGRIFISGHTVDGPQSGNGVDEWGFAGAAEQAFYIKMKQPGTKFRFTDDPNGEVYEIVGTHEDMKRFNAKNFSIICQQISDCNDSNFGGINNWAWTPFYDTNINNQSIINTLQATGTGTPTEVNNSTGNELIGIGGAPFGGGPAGNSPYYNYNGVETTSCPPCNGETSGSWDYCRREGFRVEFRRVDRELHKLAVGPITGLPGAAGIDTAVWDPRGEICHDGREALRIAFVDQNVSGGEVVIPTADAAVWETEPKEDVGLDLYYEVSDAIPMVLTNKNTPNFAPYNSKVTLSADPAYTPQTMTGTNHRVFHIGYTETTSIIGVESSSDGGVTFTPHTEDILIGQYLMFEHRSGTRTLSRVLKYMDFLPIQGDTDIPTYNNSPVFEPSSTATGYYEIESEVWQFPIKLGWFNCYSFGNGVESDRIRDDFNAPRMDKGVKASTTFLQYGQEKKGSTIIYSGIYNSISGVNNLNEFNMSEKITKDLNPTYGSIKALKTRDTDLIALTEDKVLKITTNKDALFNADGNAQLLASNRVLGTAIPFVGDYGISNNPESLASDQYRLYFTDVQRGAVLRLSNNGITPISSVGMKTWFRENLSKTKSLLGTYDKVNDEYNLTLKYIDSSTKSKTISFNESSKGWVSFKSFIPQSGVSVSGKYITGYKNQTWEMNRDIIEPDSNSNNFGKPINRNTFYGDCTSFMGSGSIEDCEFYEPSSISVMFNDMPGSVKNFRTVNYEGSQSRILRFADESYVHPDGTPFSIGDGEYYNLSEKLGWYVSDIKTDLSDGGSVFEFIEKEGKWFNKIDGAERSVLSDSHLSEFSVQGLGKPTLVTEVDTTVSNQVMVLLSSDMVDDSENTEPGDGSQTIIT